MIIHIINHNEKKLIVSYGMSKSSLLKNFSQINRDSFVDTWSDLNGNLTCSIYEIHDRNP